MRADTQRVNGLLIGRATAADLDRIMQIEQQSFTAPWTRKMFDVELNHNPFSYLDVVRPVRDGGAAGAFVGYICFWVVFEELRLMSLAVEPSMRRRGFGRALLHHALAVGRHRDVKRALLEVRASNVSALLFYEQAGFRRTAVRARYYTHPVEDAVLMELEPLPAS